MESMASVTPISNPDLPQIVVTENMPSVTPISNPDLPQIVVTEPSPLNPSQSAISAPDIPSASRADAIVKTAADVSQSVPIQVGEQHVNVKQPGSSSSSSCSENYSTVLTCTDYSEPSSVPVAESRVELAPVRRPSTEAVMPSTEAVMPSTEAVMYDLRELPRCCPEYGGCEGFYYKVSDMIDSKYALPLWIILMALPISFGFLGARYLNECKTSPATPVLLFMIGITSLFMLTAKITLILHKATWEQQIGRQFLQNTIAVTFSISLLIFVTEIMTFWRYTPSFDITSHDYCVPAFYDFAYWLNWVALGVLLLMIFLKFPKCCMLGPQS